MPEEVLFKSESNQSREEIPSYLRKVADNLDNGDAITLTVGSESVTLNPPARPTFEVKAEREGLAGNMAERSIEFGIGWDENDSEEGGGSGQLGIEQSLRNQVLIDQPFQARMCLKNRISPKPNASNTPSTDQLRSTK